MYLAICLFSDASTTFTKMIQAAEYSKKLMNFVSAARLSITHNGHPIMMLYRPEGPHLSLLFL